MSSSFWLLTMGAAISFAGDFMAGMAAGWYLGCRAEGSNDYALYILVVSFTALTLGTFPGWVAEHVKLRTALVGFNLLLACLAFGMSEVMKRDLSVNWMLLIAAGISAVGALKAQTENLAFLRSGGSRYALFIRRCRLGAYLGSRTLIGMIAGGVMHHFGVSASLVCDAASFLIVAIIASCTTIPEGEETTEAEKNSLKELWVGGMIRLYRDPPRFCSALVFVTVIAGCSLGWVLMPKIMMERFHNDTFSYGMIVTISGLGGFLVMFAGRVLRSNSGILMPLAVCSAPLSTILMSVAGNSYVLGVCYTGYVISYSVLEVQVFANLDRGEHPALLNSAAGLLMRTIPPIAWLSVATLGVGLHLTAQETLRLAGIMTSVVLISIVTIARRPLREFLISVHKANLSS